jgi:hypothetical protein
MQSSKNIKHKTMNHMNNPCKDMHQISRLKAQNFLPDMDLFGV